MEIYDKEMEEIFMNLKLNKAEALPSVMELSGEEDGTIGHFMEAGRWSLLQMWLVQWLQLATETGTLKAINLVKEKKPSVLWVSFPCGPTSSIQELNKLIQEDREEWNSSDGSAT